MTKGQFSASADPGSTSKKGEANTMQAIDGCLLALTLGATFVARSFSGDKAQLVPIIEAALSHRGFAFVDVISPCVTFNDHEGSTKSYAYTREKNVELVQADFVPFTDRDHHRIRCRLGAERDACTTAARCGCARSPRTTTRPTAIAPTPTSAIARPTASCVTGLLYLSPDSRDMHDQSDTVADAADAAALRGAVPGQRRAGEAAEEFR